MAARLYRGKWVADFRYFNPLTGKKERFRKESLVQSKRGAEAYEREMRVKLQSREYFRELEQREQQEKEELEQKAKEQETKSKEKTFAEFSELFVTNYVLVNNKPSEVANKEKHLRVHLVPYFGSKLMTEIGAADIEAYRALKLRGNPETKQKGLSKKTVNNSLNVLSKLFRKACDWGVVATIPKIEMLKISKSEKEEIDFLTADESVRLLAHLKDAQIHNMAVLALNTGLRIGELRALQWDDIDTANRKLIVRRNLWETHEGSPKNGCNREIPLNNAALKALKSQFHLKSAKVFCDDDGKPLTRMRGYKPVSTAARKAVLGRKITFHTLRHTFASQLVMRGVPIRTVQELLGHADITMTMKYSHLSPQAKHDAVAVLDSAIG